MRDYPEAFTSVLVQPNYGSRSAFVSWAVRPNIEGVVRAYRSFTGSAPWKLLTPAGVEHVSYARGYFEDTELSVEYNGEIPWYRLLLSGAGEKRQASEPVTVFNPMRRDERAGIETMLMNETGLHRASGIPAFVLLPKKYGEPAWGSDALTQEILSVCKQSGSDAGFGLPFAGGYAPPISSSVILLSKAPLDFSRDENGKSVKPIVVSFRLPPFPKPESDMLVVLPHSDDRYVISDQALPFEFRGIYPIAYEIQAQLLSRSDPRYKLPLPTVSTEVFFK